VLAANSNVLPEEAKITDSHTPVVVNETTLPPICDGIRLLNKPLPGEYVSDVPVPFSPL
jgi:hypothetical protein